MDFGDRNCLPEEIIFSNQLIMRFHHDYQYIKGILYLILFREDFTDFLALYLHGPNFYGPI